MTFSNYNEHTKPIFTSLKVMDIYELNKYFIAIFMYTYFNDKLPLNFKDYFSRNENIHSYNTRSASKVHIGYQRINYRNFSIKYRGAETWNSLPERLKTKRPYS